MPCWDSYLIEGQTIKASPKAPLDKVPVIEADSVSSTTTIKAPYGAKKRIGGGAPTNI